jgi:hypothetical protein
VKEPHNLDDGSLDLRVAKLVGVDDAPLQLLEAPFGGLVRPLLDTGHGQQPVVVGKRPAQVQLRPANVQPGLNGGAEATATPIQHPNGTQPVHMPWRPPRREWRGFLRVADKTPRGATFRKEVDGQLELAEPLQLPFPDRPRHDDGLERGPQDRQRQAIGTLRHGPRSLRQRPLRGQEPTQCLHVAADQLLGKGRLLESRAVATPDTLEAKAADLHVEVEVPDDLDQAPATFLRTGVRDSNGTFATQCHVERVLADLVEVNPERQVRLDQAALILVDVADDRTVAVRLGEALEHTLLRVPERAVTLCGRHRQHHHAGHCDPPKPSWHTTLHPIVGSTFSGAALHRVDNA